MFDCNSVYGQILLCLNTEDDLQRQTESYKKGSLDLYADESADDIRTRLQWNAGDWKYQDFNSPNFDKTWTPFQSAVSDICDDEEKDEETFLTPTRDRFMKSVCRVLVHLENQGAFKCLDRARDFKTFVADHDEPELESWNRLAEVRASFTI